jgi:hypothetical protein
MTDFTAITSDQLATPPANAKRAATLNDPAAAPAVG